METDIRKIFDEKVKDLVKLDYFPSFEEVTNIWGFELTESFFGKNDRGNEQTLEIFLKDDCRIVRFITEVETKSEGTLTYQTVYASENFKK